MIDDKQFLIGPSPLERKDWNTLQLADGKLYLSYHNKLRITHNAAATAVLIGDAWQALPDKPSPEELITADKGQLTPPQVYEMEQSWCGRYVLIYNNRLTTDACGMLNIFYSATHVSSSLNILCQITGTELQYPDIAYGVSPSFMLGPYTNYDGILRLLPSQSLNLASLPLAETRPLMPAGITPFTSDQERTQFFVDIFTTALRNMQQHFPQHQVWLALTGGVDSRTTMGLLEASGISYRTFTAWHDRITEGDKDIPPHLAATLGHDHLFIPRGQFSQTKYDDYTVHSAGYAVDQDRNFWAYGQYSQLQDRNPLVLILRGSAWGCVIDHYRHHSNPLDIYRLYPHARHYEPMRKSIEQWEHIVANDPYNHDINIWTRLFWDQREGCWLGSLEQAYDVMDGITSIQACNCRLFISTLMGFDQKERFRKLHEKKILRHVCPAICNIPYDRQYNGYSLKQNLKPSQRLRLAARHDLKIAKQFLKSCARAAGLAKVKALIRHN